MNTPPNREVAIFSAALDLEASQRAAYLDEACAGSPALRGQIETLLRVHEKAITFLEAAGHGAQTQALGGGAIASPRYLFNSPAEKAGDRIGRYKLLQQIGEGGCGVVYMAEQEEPVRRRVALKVIKLGMDTKQVIARFEAERQALALMDHPNIAKVLDAGATDTGRPYFVMELVRGVKITDYCDQHNLATKERLDLFVQVCRAIQHAHQKGVIHRDIKPSNILVASNDGVPVPKVIDFGIAKATQGRLTDQTVFTAFEQFMGTPAYMSPEQAELTMLDIDTRTDIYSLGVLLYELLTGRTPFDAKQLLAAGLDAMRRTIRESEPPRPSTCLSTMLAADLTEVAKHRQTEAPKLTHLLSGDLDWIVMKALDKDRARRYESANGLAADITRHLNDEPVVARPPSRVYEFQKTVRRHKFGFAAAAAIVLVLAGGITLTTWQAIRARSAERAQARLRTDAEKAWRTAQTEANRAEAAVKELKLSLSASDFWQGIRMIDQDNAADALPFLARCLSSNPTNDAALTRLTTLLTYRSWLRPMLTLKHEGVVNSAEFSRDGRRIVASSGAKVREWDAATGELLVRPEEPKPKEPKSAEPQIVKPNKTPSGEVARTSTPSQTNSVFQGNNVYSVNTVAYVNTPYGTITFEVKNAEPHFSPDGKSVVKAHGGMSGYGAQLWDAKSGAALAPPMKHYGPVSDTDFSPDGQRIVTASCDSTARVWDVQTAQPVTEPMKHERAVYFAKFSPDGRRIITTTEDRTVRFWDAQSGQPLTLPMKRIDSARFSRDGKRIVTASQDRTTRIWDAQNGEPLTESLRNVTGPAQLSPDGNRIVTAPGDNTLWVWDAPTARLLVEHLGSFNSIRSIQFSPDGKRIITASSGWTARVWDAQTLQLLADPIRFGRESTGQSWDAQAARPRFLPLELSPDGRRIATVSEDTTARIWDAQTGQALTKPMRHGERVSRAQFSPDGMCLVTVTEPGAVRIWDANTGQSLGAPKFPGGVTSAQLGPDGNRILTVAKEIAQVWDRQTGQPLTTPIKHNGDIRDAHFSPDGRQIVTASADFTARVWDAQTGQPLAELMRHKAEVSIARFSADGKRIVTAASDNTARVWDARTAQPLSDPLKYPEDGVESAQFSPDGKRIVTRASGVVRVWDVAPAQREFPGWLLTLAEAVSGQVLNPQGVLEKTKLNRPETLSRIREQLKQSPGDDDWIVWGRWFFADPATRTISPFSKITVPEYVNRRIQENTVASLEEAIQLSPSNSLAFAKLALLLRFDQSKNAESHARLALSLDANNGDAWHALGAVLTAKGELTEALQAIGRALALSPTNAFAWSVKGEIFENTDQLAEAFAAYSRTIELTVTNTDNVTAYGRGALLNRARVLKQLGRREDAAQDICRAYGIPPREAGARPNLIDLSFFYNAGFKGNWHNDQEDNDLTEVPTGVQTLAETQFDVRGLIQLRNGAEIAGIPAAGKCRRIHFLHGAIGAPNLTNVVIGKYVLHFADGTTQERPIVAGKDVLDWWKKPPTLGDPEGLTVAWKGENGKSRERGMTIQLYKTTWENPSPDAALTTIDFISGKKGSSPFLVAITVEP